MGRLLVALAREDPRLRVAGAIEAAGHPAVGRDAGEAGGGAARGQEFERAKRLAREGLVGERPRDEIGIVGLRAGDAVGDHTVVFGGLGERLELAHRAQSRDCLARGALRAARWVAGRPPGLYSMRDVLGL